MRLLITGGAGFVGSALARRFREDEPGAEIVVLDNLKRRGSELNVPLLQQRGIRFVHGDIRVPADLDALPGNFDVLIEASAEPSVLSGADGDPRYVLQTNLVGTLNCLEFARKRAKHFVFLSTSRVYSIEPLRTIALQETPTRFDVAGAQTLSGIDARGISETFPTHLPRSFYGATKLASEMLIQEYVHAYGLSAIIDRCGVIAGAGQFGKSDQGVFTYWVARHHFGKPLRYTGFGGTGKQVRDLLHPDDLHRLLKSQLGRIDRHAGAVFNVGGGPQGSVSLRELTELCRKTVGREVAIEQDPSSHPMDVPYYATNFACAEQTFGWRPQRSVGAIIDDIAGWIRENERQLQPLFQ